MNASDYDVLLAINRIGCNSQRLVADSTGNSLGLVNKSIKKLYNDGYLDSSYCLTEKANRMISNNKPCNAIILAAGFGMRMVPINHLTPKALLTINGEPLIERLIKQLHEVGVKDITIVVGFMKESFEYLIDAYDVELVVNNDYKTKNNLSSLALVCEKLANTYIVPADLWFKKNPFRKNELYSWYLVSNEVSTTSGFKVNRKREIVKVRPNTPGNSLVGLSYFAKHDSNTIVKRLKEFTLDNNYDNEFWEITLLEGSKDSIPARIIDNNDFYEINTFEQLREIDSGSDVLKSDAIEVIAKTFNTEADRIVDIQVLKKGMTNRSFVFSVEGRKYIMRIPGEGTDQLINRAQEADVYKEIAPYHFCDEPVYINPHNGYKITKYLDNVRVCDSSEPNDVKRCIAILKDFHERNIQVNHKFDLFEQIAFYESLWDGIPSIYKDYKKTKQKVLGLKPYIDALDKTICLTHIDAVPDNFLFYSSENDSEEKLQLTDWEYAGMQDPHVDLAMFCIYSMYGKTEIDSVIDMYFDGNCDHQTRAKIYCYIAICGLLWSNWCEYKRNLGVEFGEYSLKQYRYAKDYYKFALEEMELTD